MPPDDIDELRAALRETMRRFARLSAAWGAKGGRQRARSLSDEARAEIARKGGQARKQAMTPERRREIAKRAAEARWGRKGDTQ